MNKKNGINGKRKVCLRITVVCALFLAICISVAGCRKNGKNPDGEPFEVKIGVIFDFTGEAAAESEQMYEAVKMAVEEINAEGGVLTEGLMLSVIKKDDKGAAEETVAAYYQLVAEGVCAVIGTNHAAGMKELLNVSANENVPVITPSVTDDFVAAAADFCYQSCFSDKYMTRAAAYFTRAELKIEEVGVLYDPSVPENIVLYEDFIASALAERLEISCAREIDITDFAAVEEAFKKICAADIKAVFVAAPREEFSKVVLKAAKSSGYKGVFLGLPEYDVLMGNTEGYEVYVPCNMAPDNNSAAAAEFAARCRENFFRDGEGIETLADGVRPAYEAVRFVRDAIEAAYLAVPTQIALKLPFLEGSTALGDYEIGAYGDVKKSVDFRRIKDSTAVYAGTVFE